jgi:hypothetical protein
MARSAFPSIWLTTEPPQTGFPAKKHRGALKLDANGVRFTSPNYSLTIPPGQWDLIGFGKAGTDFFNSWVHIRFIDDTGAPGEAYLNDGRFAGWGGIFGGAKRLESALRDATTSG